MPRPETQSLLAAALLLSGCTCAGSLPGRRAVRPPEFAGLWYEREPQELAASIEGYLAGAKLQDGDVQALLVPHAGLEWSGEVAGKAFGALRGKRYDRVVLVGVEHDSAFEGAALPAEGGFDTPLGALAVDEPAVELLARYPGFARRAASYDHEYSLEVQLPFVRHLWPEAKVVTVLLGSVSEEEIPGIGRVLRNVLDERTLLVVAATLTHFGSGAADGEDPFPLEGDQTQVEAALRAFEQPVIDALAARDPDLTLSRVRELNLTTCGLEVALVGLHALGPGERATVAAQGSSLAVQFDPEGPSGASYLGLVFPGRFPAVPELGGDERRFLGRLAWDAVAAGVAGREPAVPDDLPPRLAQRGGAFVTIYLHGMLKGCMGLLDWESLAGAVLRAGALAASGDPRFPALRADQLAQCELEVSALGPMIPIASTDDFEPGRHGLLLTRGHHRGLLLPQVATRFGMDREAFLGALAEKAGLPSGDLGGASLLRFGVEAFAPRDA